MSRQGPWTAIPRRSGSESAEAGAPGPLAAGIVNVTVDSMFEGARSGTPEQAVEDGRALVEAGFDMLDVGAVAARSRAAGAGGG